MSRWVSVVALALSITAWGCGDDDDGSNGGDSGADEAGSGGNGSSGKGGSGGTGGSGGSNSTGKPDGGTAGMGGSGGSGGSGGGQVDTGVPDPCAGVADACTREGVSCDGEKLVTCAKNADGCLVATTTDCATGDTSYCDEDAETPVCAACAATDCTEASVTCVDGDTLETCAADANGCLVKTTTDCTAGNNDYCDAAATPDRCASCPPTSCTQAGTSCDGKNLITCTENANGCLIRTVTDCTTQPDDVNTCTLSGGTASCTRDVCLKPDGTAKDDVCVKDESSCSDDVLVTCEDDGDGPGGVGCKIAHRVACSTVTDPDPTRPAESKFNYCNGTTDMCAYDRCLEVANACSKAGITCNGKDRLECKLDSDPHPCLVETVLPCASNEMCTDADGPEGATDAECVTCVDDPGCETAADGDTSCNGTNVFTKCADTDGNGCLEKIDEDCGPTSGANAKFTCDDTDGCVYSGPTGCDEPLNANNVIRQSGLLAGFDTTSATNQYGIVGNAGAGYVCPGLDPMYPFNAAGKDILFALEVPAHSAIEVQLVNVAGFTSTGAWMLLLPGCADTGTAANMQIERMCEAYSDQHVSFANEGDTTQRKYLVIDAEANSQGTFDLNVITRALSCGDGERDGSEKCDDGNANDNDGCKSDCTLETDYVCTSGDPSVCTKRPANDQCGNVMCAALPTQPANLDTCCTRDAKCGVAYAPLYGNACIERDQAGANDTECPDVSNMLGFPFTLFAPTIQGCCRPTGECGLLAAAGGGCMTYADTWTAMLDGAGRVYYDGPFGTPPSCTP